MGFSERKWWPAVTFPTGGTHLPFTCGGARISSYEAEQEKKSSFHQQCIPPGEVSGVHGGTFWGATASWLQAPHCRRTIKSPLVYPLPSLFWLETNQDINNQIKATLDLHSDPPPWKDFLTSSARCSNISPCCRQTQSWWEMFLAAFHLFFPHKFANPISCLRSIPLLLMSVYWVGGRNQMPRLQRSCVLWMYFVAFRYLNHSWAPY